MLKLNLLPRFRMDTRPPESRRMFGIILFFQSPDPKVFVAANGIVGKVKYKSHCELLTVVLKSGWLFWKECGRNFPLN